MNSVCVLLADGFEEIEAVALIDILRRAEIQVTTVAVTTEGHDNHVRGSHEISIQADISLPEALHKEWDLVLLPGGMPGAVNLRDHPVVQKMIKQQVMDGRKVGAICAAPIALGAAGALVGKRATSYPGFEDQLVGATSVDTPVVVDGNVMTSRGVGTAIDFALEIVAQLRGRSLATTLREKMLVHS